MVTVRITELYDMKTALNRVGIVGVHTPSGSSIAKRWHGLMANYRFLRVRSCDIRLACASVLPADPLQVGTDTTDDGLIAPQDLMNPLLYRAMTNEGWNALLNRVYSSQGIYDVNSVTYSGENGVISSMSEATQELLYYGLLGSDEWRKAMPQAGLTMGGLRPLVYPLLSGFGNSDIQFPSDGTSAVSYPKGQVSDVAGTPSTPSGNQRVTVMRGHAIPMPRLPATTPGSVTVDGVPEDVFSPVYIPKSFVACIVLPPAKMHSLFFRLSISWVIEFSDLCSVLDKTSAAAIADAGDYTYRRSYTFTTSKNVDEVKSDDDSADETNSIDTLNAPVNLIVEK